MSKTCFELTLVSLQQKRSELEQTLKIYETLESNSDIVVLNDRIMDAIKALAVVEIQLEDLIQIAEDPEAWAIANVDLDADWEEEDEPVTDQDPSEDRPLGVEAGESSFLGLQAVHGMRMYPSTQENTFEIYFSFATEPMINQTSPDMAKAAQDMQMIALMADQLDKRVNHDDVDWSNATENYKLFAQLLSKISNMTDDAFSYADFADDDKLLA